MDSVSTIYKIVTLGTISPARHTQCAHTECLLVSQADQSSGPAKPAPKPTLSSHELVHKNSMRNKSRCTSMSRHCHSTPTSSTHTFWYCKLMASLLAIVGMALINSQQQQKCRDNVIPPEHPTLIPQCTRFGSGAVHAGWIQRVSPTQCIQSIAHNKLIFLFSLRWKLFSRGGGT